MQATQIIISGAVVTKKKSNGRYTWLLVKQGDDDGWQIPKITARKGESSVRASIRMMGEMGGMNAKVIEEAGHAQGTMEMNGKTIPKRTLYYLMLQKSAGEAFGFKEAGWFDYQKAVKKIASKKEVEVFIHAKAELDAWIKAKKDVIEEADFPEEEYVGDIKGSA